MGQEPPESALGLHRKLTTGAPYDLRGSKILTSEMLRNAVDIGVGSIVENPVQALQDELLTIYAANVEC